MSRHEGVSCDSCLKSNFNGRRYKCLICYDYDLCADCYEEGVTSTRHLVDHPMQCILTRADIELFFGGEMLNSEQPQSFTCPYCKKMGFSDATLLEHVSAEHSETSLEVVCPLCAGLPGGEPNLVTDDFAGHLTLEHRTGPRELISFLDEPSAIRHGGGVRRIPSRTLGGPRPRRSNMHFSSSSGLSALSPSGRDSVDPIAELLSQLSGVRRGGPQTSQLQQLQMQIQLERQQVSATRQQLERLPRRAHPMVLSANSNATMQEVISGSNISTANASGAATSNGGCRTNEWTVTSSSTNQQSQSSIASNAINTRESGSISGNNMSLSVSGANGSAVGGDSQSQYLLTKFMQPTLSDMELAVLEKARADRSQFVQALLLSTLSSASLETQEIYVKKDREDRKEQERSQGGNSDTVNNGKSATDTEFCDETMRNTNAASCIQSSINTSTSIVTRRCLVNQQQQTSPEDFADEYRQMQQTYSTKKKSPCPTGGTSSGGKSLQHATSAERGIERRGRPPPPPVSGASAAGSQQQQQSQQGQQKFKTSAASTKPPSNQIPDTR